MAVIDVKPQNNKILNTTPNNQKVLNSIPNNNKVIDNNFVYLENKSIPKGQWMSMGITYPSALNYIATRT